MSMLTLLEIITKTTDFLAAKGVEQPRLNSELLIGQVLGLNRMQLYLQFERLLTEAELDRLRPLVKRRGQREPLAYILGRVDFFHIALKVDRRALIPRPETEQLCELVTTRLSTPPARVLELGTGSGAIALGLAAFFPQTAVTAVDLSEAALSLARENAEALGLAARVHFLPSDWFTALPEGATFDLVIANPPYLSEAETGAAESEVRDHEPREALTPGCSGTEALDRIISAAPRFLAADGLLALETGITQHTRLSAGCAAAGFARNESIRDDSGHDRFLLAWRR